MVSQFKSPNKVRLLGDLDFSFPEGTHAIGRLDSHSEGLLLLTTNKKITALLFQGIKKHSRTYLVMVKNKMSEETIQQLKDGIPITVSNGQSYSPIPEKIELIKDPLEFYPYAHDSRMKYNHTWLAITLTEGKYHQVRKMVFNSGHRCLRLIRISIEDLYLANLPPGAVKEIPEVSFFDLLKLNA